MRQLAILFPGQGSQYMGMCSKFHNRYLSVKLLFDEASSILGLDVKKLCFEASYSDLIRTDNAQLSVFIVNIAMYRVFMEELNLKPAFLAGHSLGELSALTCSGGINLFDSFEIIKQRGTFMREASYLTNGGMAAVTGINSSEIEKICADISCRKQIIVVSNYNSSNQTIISGHFDAIKLAHRKLESMGCQVVPLNVSAPFHSPLMQIASEKLHDELQKYSYNSLEIPVISNVTGLPYSSKDSIVENLTQHIIKPVLWKKSVDYLKSKGVTVFIEIGPKTVLRDILKKNTSSIQAFSFDDDQDYEYFIRKYGKTHIMESSKKHAIIQMCLKNALCTKNNHNCSFDEYTKNVVQPYLEIQDMQDNLIKQMIEPTVEQTYFALRMLKTVLSFKITPIEECIDRFNQIFMETETEEFFSDFKMVE